MKNLIFIVFLALMASTKVTLQGMFAKKNVKTLQDALCFNGVIFICAALVFCINAFNCHLTTVVFGVIFGILTVVFQAVYTKAMSMGNVSATVMIVNLSMIIPVSVSVLAYGEKLNAFKIVGMIFTVLSLVISAEKTENAKGGTIWFLLAILSSLTNGALSVCQKIFGNTAYSGENTAFVAWAYITAVIISFAVYGIIRLGKKERTFKFGKLAVLCAVGAGVILGTFQSVYTYAVSHISGVVLFPTYNGFSLLLSTLSGVILLKEKLSLRQKISVFTGITAIVLLNV